MQNPWPAIPEVINFTDLRYKTVKLRKKLEEGKEPLLLVNRSNEIGVIIPIKMYRQLSGRLRREETKKERQIRLEKVSSEMDKLAEETAKHLPVGYESGKAVRETRDERTKNLLARHQ